MKKLFFGIYAADKTKAAFQSVGQSVRRTKGQFAGLKKSISGMGALIVTAFAGASFKAIADFADKIDKMSLRLGITTGALSELSFVGDLAGVSFSQLTMGLQRMTRRISEAANGMGEARGALNELGLDALKLNEMSPDEQFEEITKALQGVENQSEKVRLAFKLFDSEGVALIQTMDANGESMASLRQRARELNVTISEETADAIADMNDAWTEVGAALKGVGTIILGALAPIFEWMGKAIADLVGWIGKMLKKISYAQSRIAAFTVGVYEALGIIDETVADEALLEIANRWDDITVSTEGSKKAAEELNKTLDQTNIKIDKVNRKTGGRSRGGNKSSIGLGGLGGEQMDAHIEAWKEAEAEAKRTADSISDAFKDGIGDAVKNFDDLGDVARNTLLKIRDSIVDSQINNLFNQFGGAGGSGGIIQGIVGGAGGSGGIAGIFSSIASSFGGAFADGGSFGAGKPIMVGERGPEMILPRSAGTVIPNNALGGSSGAHITYQIDARGAEAGVEKRIMAALKQVNQSIEPRALAAISAEQRSNPSYGGR